MSTTPNLEQLAAAQKANAEVMMALLRTAFNGVEQLTALNLNTARSVLEDGVSGAKALLGAKDVQEALSIQ
ncbi:MAG: phasin family protein, partial [Betaproteobacteria bacterium]|nr:phasin family protein [Betaproteobacteria bacterium]